MADKKISQLTAASTPLAGTEVLPIVQSGQTVKATAQDVANLALPYKVYTALLTQSGGDNAQVLEGGLLTKGVSYVFDYAEGTWDFTNVGGPKYPDTTPFVATANQEPVDWANTGLLFNTGAPVVTVLENTIGNIWFTYSNVGEYLVNSDALFIYGKTYTYIAQFPADAGVFDGTGASLNRIYLDSNSLQLSTGVLSTSSGIDSLLNNTPIEIRVYN